MTCPQRGHGVFAQCFLNLTWNLACRANNTGRIRMNQIRWASSFDAFEIFFGHTKTDQAGEEARFPRHCYANPIDPIVCPVLALAMYFTCCFNSAQENDGQLFPGNDQNQRFSKIFNRCLAEHKADVQALGYRLDDLGTHSIRKGAVSYLSSLVQFVLGLDGPWESIYMRYVTAGDEFVGRCISLLPILSTKFGSSPPFFQQKYDGAWAIKLCHQQFKFVGRVDELQRVLLHFVFIVTSYVKLFCRQIIPFESAVFFFEIPTFSVSSNQQRILFVSLTLGMTVSDIHLQVYLRILQFFRNWLKFVAGNCSYQMRLRQSWRGNR